MPLIIVEVDNRLNEKIHKVIANHGLRGFDALHLASALTLGSAVAENFVFACYDKRLNRPIYRANHLFIFLWALIPVP